MDRSFLSDQQVVAASRDFVCIRMATYENAQEAEVHMRVFRGRDGLENSVFGILDPTGQRLLTRGHRSPSGVFRDAATMARRMGRIASRFSSRDASVGLPLLEDARIALNVAAADSQQLAIIHGEGEKLEQLELQLAKLAWSKELVGRLLYARADATTDWDVIAGSDQRGEHGILVVQPGEFGVDGKVVAKLGLEEMRDGLIAATRAHEPRAIDTRRLRRKGARLGLRWQPKLPISDKRSRRR